MNRHYCLQINIDWPLKYHKRATFGYQNLRSFMDTSSTKRTRYVLELTAKFCPSVLATSLAMAIRFWLVF
jgi:hypothetical protein